MFAKLQTLLVRPRAWWMNKVPSSVLLTAVLLQGRPLSWVGFACLVGVVLVVCCAANYGYGLNELYDREEDARGGRANVANERGPTVVWRATILSALFALVLSWVVAGWWGVAAFAVELLLPATYSIPPIRTKERTWLAVLSDALAAHVFPALLAMLALAHHGVRSFSASLVASVLIWALALGLRGILSHVIWAFDHDRSVGLTTVAHGGELRRLTLLILVVFLPLELGGLAAVIALCQPGRPLLILLAAFAVNELRRASTPRVVESFRMGYFGRVFRPVTDRYIPFVDETFYKQWGPPFVAISAALVTRSAAFAVLAILYVAVYWPRYRNLSWRDL